MQFLLSIRCGYEQSAPRVRVYLPASCINFALLPSKWDRRKVVGCLWFVSGNHEFVSSWDTHFFFFCFWFVLGMSTILNWWISPGHVWTLVEVRCQPKTKMNLPIPKCLVLDFILHRSVPNLCIPNFSCIEYTEPKRRFKSNTHP
jgi:hypothetical protein